MSTPVAEYLEGMLEWTRGEVDDRVLSPVVLAVLVLVVLLRVLHLWLATTMSLSDLALWFAHSLPGPLAVDHALHAVGGLFLLLLVFELGAARRAAPWVRKGRVIGASLALVVVGGVHAWARSMRAVVDLVQ